MTNHIEVLRGLVARALFEHDHGDLNDGPMWEDDEAARLHYLGAADAALAAMGGQGAKEPTMTTERKARELLAEEVAAMEKTWEPCDYVDEYEKAALRAIIRALESAGQGEAQAQGVIDLRGGGRLLGARVEGNVQIIADQPRSVEGCVFIGDSKVEDWGLLLKQPEALAGGEHPGPDWRYLYQGRRDVISRWHARAVALGYEGVEDLLSLALPCIVNNAGEERTTPPAKVPEGWRLVPVEPTEAMKRAGVDRWIEAIEHAWTRKDELYACQCAYAAMLAAAPAPKEGDR